MAVLNRAGSSAPPSSGKHTRKEALHDENENNSSQASVAQAEGLHRVSANQAKAPA